MSNTEQKWGRFEHTPLMNPESIRLLHIRQGEQAADEISIDLHHFPLASTPEYVALSYVWGSDHPSHTITCDGAQFLVRENLYRALHHLRAHVDQHQYLWIDAICINQGNIRERQEQIRLMHRIYKSAQSIICWLGEERSLSDDPLGDFHSSSGITPSGRNNLSPLLLRPYWTRTWVLQEVLLSQRRIILLDHHQLEWDYFWSKAMPREGEVLHYACQPQLRQALRFHALTSSESALYRLLKDPTLAKLDPTISLLALDEFRQVTSFAKELHTTDPRDMVYSWLGVAVALGINVPLPDYTKPVDVVFLEAKAAAMEGYHHRSNKAVLPAFKRPHNILTENVPDPKNSTFFTIRTRAGSPKPSPEIVDGKSSLSNFEGLSAELSESEFDSDGSTELLIELASKSCWREILKKLVAEGKLSLLVLTLNQMRSRQCSDIPFEYFLQGQKSYQGSSNKPQGANKSEISKNKRQKVSSSSGGATTLHNNSNDDDHDNNDDDSEGRSRKQPEKSDHDGIHDRLACPYFQRNPRNPRLHRACRGPGFADLHQLK